MDFVSPLLDIASRMCDCSAKHVVYIRELPENLNSLRTAMNELKSVYEDVKERVEREEKLQKKRTRVVDGWIQSVEAMENVVGDLLAKGDRETQNKCFGTSYCPKNCRASYKIGKMVHRKMKDVALKKREGLNFCIVAEPPPAPPGIERPLDWTVGLDSLFNHVCMQLQDDKVRSVGLYGMGGVGKTTLLTRINNELLKIGAEFEFEFEFETVIWVTVSRPANLEKIQRALFNKLEIPSHKWEGRSEDEMKEEIFNVLKIKKFVLLLDDVWEFLDLSAVGIPPINNGNKSKVVFTTRSSTVCRDMGAKGIEVKGLAWAEAFGLFQKYVGEDTLNAHPHIPNLAQIVAKECGGLPLALITIGRAMMGTKSPEEWEKKIQMLKNCPAKFPGMENSLFSHLAFSYDSLPDEATKSCFLYCSLFPEDYEIDCDELVQLWIGEGFLDEQCDIKEARTIGEEIVATLNHACLLEINYICYNLWKQKKIVKMHDVIRDMALWLACQNGNKKQNRFVVVNEGKLVTFQEVEKWKGAQRISLIHPRFEEHMEMESPSFCNLQTLLLFANLTKPLSLPRGFFSYMPNLTVLDLANHYKLDDLPMEIGELVTLQYLNLSNTGIGKIPMELWNLKKVRILILNDMKRLKLVPSKIISGLSSLRLFSIVDSGEVTDGDCRGLLEELEGLKCMREVSISLDSFLSIQTLLHSHKLQICMKHLKVQFCSDNMSILNLLFPYLEELYVAHCSKLEDVSLTFRPRDRCFYHLSSVAIFSCDSLRRLTCLIYAPNLKFLCISRCVSMEKVIQVYEYGKSELASSLGLFSRLVLLFLWDLPKLRSICEWSLLFPSLKAMNVKGCPNLSELSLDSKFRISENLEEIKGEQEWWDELEWKDQTIMHKLTPYFKPLISRTAEDIYSSWSNFQLSNIFV